MIERGPKLLLQSAPFLRRGITTPGLMGEVLLALVPVVLAACWYFGVAALLVIAATTAGAVITERLFCGRAAGGSSLLDGSAVLTGILLGLCLPPAIPLWMAFLGGVAAIGLGKAVFGGLGRNLFNPALVGRAFLQAAFPTAITTWSAPGAGEGLLSVPPAAFAPPFLSPAPVDAVSTATPLATIKFGGDPAPLADLLLGGTAGSLGETSAALLIVLGVVLALRRTFDWRIPLAIVLSVALFGGLVKLFSPEAPSPLYLLLSGGLLFGAVFMATDPVTSPLAPRGAWIFGAGIGVIVVLIRLWGGLPEGVMYAILLMNAATPLIDRITQPRPFGRDAQGRARPCPTSS